MKRGSLFTKPCLEHDHVHCTVRLQRMTEREIEEIQNSLRLNERNGGCDMATQTILERKDIGIDTIELVGADSMQVSIARCDMATQTILERKDIGIDTSGLVDADLMQFQTTRCDFGTQTSSTSNDHSSANSSEDSEDEDGAVFCLCRQTSYGSMVRCDNSLCGVKWFHFRCVSLKSTPKGLWFCPNCRQK